MRIGGPTQPVLHRRQALLNLSAVAAKFHELRRSFNINRTKIIGMASILFSGGSSRRHAAVVPARYNGTGLQRERILACLRDAGPAGVPGPELADRCTVPSVTKRISELRRAGWSIDSLPHIQVGADGSVNTVARYVLNLSETTQADLFGAAAAAE